MIKLLFILTAALFSGAAFAFQNNCRVDMMGQSTELIVDGVPIAHYVDAEEAYAKLSAIRAIGACEPSRCQLGTPNTVNALRLEDAPLEFTGTLGEAIIVFAQWRADHVCDFEPTTEASVTLPPVDDAVVPTPAAASTVTKPSRP
jgi:hypothetical protein